jgi:hypothetical protein
VVLADDHQQMIAKFARRSVRSSRLWARWKTASKPSMPFLGCP